jgi:Spy/CpxP family protein refolding chaperone
MNYFSKFKFAIWTVVVLSVVILATIGTMLYFISANKPDRQASEDNKRSPKIEHFFQKELGFSAEQEKKANEFRSVYFKKMGLIFASLEQKRIVMINELNKPQPDTVVLNQLADSFGSLHAQMRRETVKQLLKIRSICNPEQVKKLNSLNEKLIRPEGMHRKGPNHPR